MLSGWFILLYVGVCVCVFVHIWRYSIRKRLKPLAPDQSPNKMGMLLVIFFFPHWCIFDASTANHRVKHWARRTEPPRDLQMKAVSASLSVQGASRMMRIRALCDRRTVHPVDNRKPGEEVDLNPAWNHNHGKDPVDVGWWFDLMWMIGGRWCRNLVMIRGFFFTKAFVKSYFNHWKLTKEIGCMFYKTKCSCICCSWELFKAKYRHVAEFCYIYI